MSWMKRARVNKNRCRDVPLLPIAFIRPRSVPITPMVLLIGNYALDRQQSMQRFATMMLQGLAAAGVPAEVAAPAPVLGKLFGADNFLGKWLAYIDKFVL